MKNAYEKADPPSDAFDDKFLELLEDFKKSKEHVVWLSEIRSLCRIAHGHCGGEEGDENYEYCIMLARDNGFTIKEGMRE